MRLHRPSLQPWPIVAAVIASYFIAGYIRAIAEIVALLPAAHDSILDRVLVSMDLPSRVAWDTLSSGGFPTLSDGQSPANLYPIIVPVAAVLLAHTTGVIRLWFKPKKWGLCSLAIVVILQLLGFTAGVIDLGFVRGCAPYNC